MACYDDALGGLPVSASEEISSEFGGRPGSGASFRVPPLHGRHVFLRQIQPEDYRLIRAADGGGDLAVRWRFRGSSSSPEQWAQSLWRGVLVQYLVVGLHDPTPLGLVAVYNANFQDGYAYLAAERFGARRATPLMVFGLALFIDYVFACWDFHKLYLEVAEYNVGQFQSGIGRLFTEEARLGGHIWYGERRWDQLILALYRDTWRQEGSRLLAASISSPERRLIVQMPATPES
jgi:hypothetical protein